MTKPTRAQEPAAKPDWMVGPFEYHKVIVGGRVIPRLTARVVSEYQIELTVDNRFCAIFTRDAAQQAAYLISEALAVGAGYPHAGALTKDQPFAPQGLEVSDGL